MLLIMHPNSASKEKAILNQKSRRENESVPVHLKLQQLQGHTPKFTLHQCLNVRLCTDVQDYWVFFVILLPD